MGRQPWIVQGLLKTADAHSPAVSSSMLVFSVVVFYCLYLLLLGLDIWLMRRYAKVDPPELERDETGETRMPAIGY
jgi:cytochrome bd ubiquinol oxidase subunit I